MEFSLSSYFNKLLLQPSTFLSCEKFLGTKELFPPPLALCLSRTEILFLAMISCLKLFGRENGIQYFRKDLHSHWVSPGVIQHYYYTSYFFPIKFWRSISQEVKRSLTWHLNQLLPQLQKHCDSNVILCHDSVQHGFRPLWIRHCQLIKLHSVFLNQSKSKTRHTHTIQKTRLLALWQTQISQIP